MAKQNGFKRYSIVMDLFDQLIDGIEGLDKSQLSPQQLHDMAYYYEVHLSKALALLGAERLPEGKKAKAKKPPSKKAAPKKLEDFVDGRLVTLTLEQVRDLMEEGRKARLDLEKRYEKLRQLSVEERFSKAR